MIQQKIENDLSGQLQFQDTGRIEGEFPHGPFQDVNGDGVIGSFKQITAVGSGHDLFIFAGKTVDGYIHQPLTRLGEPFFKCSAVVFWGVVCTALLGKFLDPLIGEVLRASAGNDL